MLNPTGGGASVLLRKKPAHAEVYNDLDDLVVTLFRVLRDPVLADRLIEALRLTPFSRIEFVEAVDAAPTDDPVEMARRLVVRSYMGFGSNASSGRASSRIGFRGRGFHGGDYAPTGFRANSRRSGTTPAHDWANYPDCLAGVIDRLRGVTIEHREARLVMSHHDGADTLHYVDPPYLPETRSLGNRWDNKHMYRHELTRADHIDLLTFLRTLKGLVVLSGYPAPLYDEMLPDWRRVERRAYADGARSRVEVLWINPAASLALRNVQERLAI